MSASAPKDTFTTIGIHRVPSHLSKKDFDSKIEAWVDDLVKLPVVQKNALKVEILIQNTVLDTHATRMGFPPAEPIVIIVMQSESEAQMVEILNDPAVIKLGDRGREFQMQSGASSFSVEVVAVSRFPSRKDTIPIIGIYKVPRQFAAEQYGAKFKTFMDNSGKLPVIERNQVKLEAVCGLSVLPF
ncbi:hypothetical protein B0H16DRAFT_1506346 [Mycena metata]|uniref:Uncharacterized protein n=1 Tax=Mycena metata TaxID=1033252 RepID=A0AAD7K1H1_9AGAR|nr:hypothetical protein B0H16DRAFT_1506346 [Mycena metata]